MSEEVKEAIRLCNNVIENADYMEYEYMKEYKKSSIDILVKEIERLEKENKELDKHITLIEQLWKDCIDDNNYLTNENTKLEFIIKEVREIAKEKIKQYEKYINDLKQGDFSKETIHRERTELIFRIREQEELLEILNKENE